jgi:protein-S-isoprenylcysteine O-methyltransferase Ste14
MIVLRIVLFSGMVVHKLIWEILKVSDKNAPKKVFRPPITGLKYLVKLGKTVVLLLLILQTLFLNILPLSSDPARLRLIGTIIYFIGLLIAIIGRLQLGRNWANLEDYQVLPGQSLIQTGIYKYIRHPIYIGDVLLLLGLELALNSWLVLGVVVLFLYVILQARKEENILANAFPGYANYRKRTKMFIPYII